MLSLKFLKCMSKVCNSEVIPTCALRAPNVCLREGFFLFTIFHVFQGKPLKWTKEASSSVIFIVFNGWFPKKQAILYLLIMMTDTHTQLQDKTGTRPAFWPAQWIGYETTMNKEPFFQPQGNARNVGYHPYFLIFYLLLYLYKEEL